MKTKYYFNFLFGLTMSQHRPLPGVVICACRHMESLGHNELGVNLLPGSSIYTEGWLLIETVTHSWRNDAWWQHSTYWWHHMETLSALWTLCGGNHRSPVNSGHRWIPLRKASDAELLCYLWCAPEQIPEQTIEMLVILDAMAHIMMSL